jgi:ubiquinone biosynthesis protein COQ9
MPKDEKTRLLEAVMVHVPFDGWTQAAMDAAVSDTGIDAGRAQALYPRGPVDMALAYHQRGDDEMAEAFAATDLTGLRYSEKVALCIRLRLEAADKELVRRGMTLFALPVHAADGSKALWGTADRIWTLLGDTSRDVNWYTKRATLSAVYSSTLLYWLGDDSADHAATWAFLDRRIENVMQFERFKGRMRENPLVSALMAGPQKILDQIRAPATPPGHQSGQDPYKENSE